MASLFWTVPVKWIAANLIANLYDVGYNMGDNFMVCSFYIYNYTVLGF